MSEVDKSGDTPCYVGKGKCGHYYCAMVDSPDMKKENAREIAKIVKRGDELWSARQFSSCAMEDWIGRRIAAQEHVEGCADDPRL